MRRRMRMPDRTEALLGSRGDFSDVGKQAVGIGAIDAADFLDGIQISQAASVEDQVVLTPNFRDSKDGKMPDRW